MSEIKFVAQTLETKPRVDHKFYVLKLENPDIDPKLMLPALATITDAEQWNKLDYVKSNIVVKMDDNTTFMTVRVPFDKFEETSQLAFVKSLHLDSSKIHPACDNHPQTMTDQVHLKNPIPGEGYRQPCKTKGCSETVYIEGCYDWAYDFDPWKTQANLNAQKKLASELGIHYHDYCDKCFKRIRDTFVV